MSLTDDWKAGKLKYGWYWVTNSKRGVVPDQYMPDDNWLVSNGFCITEVLAPCDYEELLRLRTLLKECKPYIQKEMETIKGAGFCNCDWAWKTSDLITRINAALGESEE